MVADACTAHASAASPTGFALPFTSVSSVIGGARQKVLAFTFIEHRPRGRPSFGSLVPRGPIHDSVDHELHDERRQELGRGVESHPSKHPTRPERGTARSSSGFSSRAPHDCPLAFSRAACRGYGNPKQVECPLSTNGGLAIMCSALHADGGVSCLARGRFSSSLVGLAREPRSFFAPTHEPWARALQNAS